MTTILYVLLAIVLLGILVVVHEFGHFLFARLCGIEVMEFAVGFGPKLISWKSRRHDTVFSLRLITMGGFCAFYGEDDAEGKHRDDPRAYARQKVWKRMLSVLMGPGMNFVLAFVVLTLFFWIGGTAVYDPYITAVEPGGPAEMCGMLAGDVVLSVNGVNVLDGTTDTLTGAIAGFDGVHPLQMVLRHTDGIEEQVELSPFYDEQYGRFRVGVQIGAKARVETLPDGQTRVVRESVSLGDALLGGWKNCVAAGTAVLNALRDMVTTGKGLDQTSGPVGVVSVVSQGVRTGGFEMFINYLVLISVNLGVMNLLPIPGLDGSRFLFMLLEAIRRKPVPPEKEAVVHLVGMVFLFAVMIFFTFRDVLNLFR